MNYVGSYMSKIDFIQIGANVGKNKHDIIWILCRKNKWGGILVEPLPQSFELLKKNYSDVPNLLFEQAAIMPYDGETKFYFSPEFKNECQQASTVKNHFHVNTATMTLPCMTIESLVKKYGLLDTSFELLQIDVEGMDDKILLSTDFTRIIPKYIRYESIHLKGNRNMIVLEHLKKFGYRRIPDLYNDMTPFLPPGQTWPQGEPNFDTLVERI